MSGDDSGGRGHGVVGRVVRSPWLPAAAPAAIAAALSRRPVGMPPARLSVEVEDRPLTIPRHDRRLGPVTRATMRRAGAVWLAAYAAGAASLVRTREPRATAFALGMMAPGAGFLYTRRPGLATLSAAAQALGALAWWGTGNFVVSPAIWASAAVVAGRDAPRRATWSGARVVVPAAVAAGVALQGYRLDRAFRAQKITGEQRNALLEGASPPLRGDARPAVHVGEELGDLELALTRRFVDVARMAPDDWSSFTILDQFQPAALRYQINGMQWSLAMQQYTRTPAFEGYLSDAQARLLERYQQRKVWGYWRLENIWGNLDPDPDPVPKQNIMLSGYLLMGLGLFETATGDRRFSEPGALRFVWSDGREFAYSYPELAEAVFANFAKSPWGMFACEPHWIFHGCNMIGATGIRLYDRLYGRDYWSQIGENWIRGFEEEMTRADGSQVQFRSTRIGFGMGPSVPLPFTWLRPLAPHIADRNWLLFRKTAFFEHEGRLVSGLSMSDQLLDIGNYSFNPVMSYAFALDEATEVGDEEARDVLRAELLERVSPRMKDGHVDFPGASVWGHGHLARALFNRKAGWLDVVTRGRPVEWRDGPVIKDVPYPRLMVARAETDGRALDAVLRATNGGGRFTLQLGRLSPTRSYAVTGALQDEITADEHGRASVDVDVDQRVELRLAPTT